MLHVRAIWFVLLAVGIQMILATTAARQAAADRILLRNLELIRDRTVTSFDPDGVVLDNGRRLGWDQIERGQLAEQQAEFDQQLQQLGEPLFRIRKRLEVHDFEQLHPHAEKLFPIYRDRQSATAFMVSQALFWSRLNRGERAAALVPYLHCYQYLKQTAESGDSTVQYRPLRIDPQSGLTAELVPIWLDGEAAKSALPQVVEAVRAIPAPRPACTYIYVASLALIAGDMTLAQRTISSLPSSSDPSGHWRMILQLQQQAQNGRVVDNFAGFENRLHEMSPYTRAVALYWLGLAKLSLDDPRQKQNGMLHLLTLPATTGRRFPDLAAGGIYHTMRGLQAMGDHQGYRSLEQELTHQYSKTIFAKAQREGTDR